MSDIIPSSYVLQPAMYLRVQLVTEAKNCVKIIYLKECVRQNVSVRHLLLILLY
jgi:hypothetical protein